MRRGPDPTRPENRVARSKRVCTPLSQVPGLGIQSLAEPLIQLGYEQQVTPSPCEISAPLPAAARPRSHARPNDGPLQGDLFEFPAKKLIATWFAPRDKRLYERGLPRIFVSQIQVTVCLAPFLSFFLHKHSS